MSEPLKARGSQTAREWWTRQSGRTRFVLLFAAAIWVCAGGLVAWQYFVQEPQTALQAAHVREVVRSIEPPPEVRVLSQSSDQKPGQVLVTTTYASAPAHSNVLAYYRGLLSQQGWRVETAFASGSCFSRGADWVSIEFVSGAPDEYVLGVSWGLSCR